MEMTPLKCDDCGDYDCPIIVWWVNPKPAGAILPGMGFSVHSRTLAVAALLQASIKGGSVRRLCQTPPSVAVSIRESDPDIDATLAPWIMP